MNRGEEDAVIDLAGRAAQRRAQRPDAEGWCRWPSLHESVCFHEAGHAIVAAALGRFPQWAIAAKPEISRGRVVFNGRAHIGNSPEQGAETVPTLEGNALLESDFTKAARFCKFMSERGWLSYMRTLYQRADAILEAHWPAVKILAIELREKGTVHRPDIEDIMRRWPRKE
jgi:hypothetical protein